LGFDAGQSVKENCLPRARKLLLRFREAIRSGSRVPAPDGKLVAYYVERNRILSSKNIHLIGRWYDLPNRIKRKKGLRYVKLGDVCTISDGLSPNMATTPGEYTLIVPAEEKKTADHFNFEAKAVCIPLVSSAGHGNAEINRIHYHEGKFALATTMCCLVSRDEKVLNPRFLYFMLDAVRNKLLVPLMAGATNVTMKSEQLRDVEIPLPSPEDQALMVRRIDLLAYAKETKTISHQMEHGLHCLVGKKSAKKMLGLAAVLADEATSLPKLSSLL
jgi:hypothetical protein